MTENKRFNRTITGEIYDSQNDDFVDEDYGGKPLGYEDGVIILLNTLHEENVQLKARIEYLERKIQRERNIHVKEHKKWEEEIQKENEQLKKENKRLTNKLNKTALELVDECISQGKATEISEMSYREFLDYRAENGKPMELQL